jgi:putative SOS response-associated peptidase YedK
VPFVTAGEDGHHKPQVGRWWLVPWWAKEMPKQAMFNGRHVRRFQGCLRIDALPDPGRRLLRVDEIA